MIGIDVETTTVSWEKVFQVRAQVYHTLGNALLHPLDSTSWQLISRRYWNNFAFDPANEQMETALGTLCALSLSQPALDSDESQDTLAGSAVRLSEAAQAMLKALAAEFTRLFVGPGRPQVPLWESLYQPGGVCLFGQPTFDMRARLRAQGLVLNHDLHQLEDHLGVQLLYLSAQSESLCRLSSENQLSTSIGLQALNDQYDLVTECLLTYVDQVCALADQDGGSGFYAAILNLVWGVLIWDQELLEEARTASDNRVYSTTSDTSD